MCHGNVLVSLSMEITAETTSPVASRSSRLRSKMSNGSKLLPMTDGRSATARRFKDLVEDIAADLGGKDHLSEGQRQLIRRAAMLSAESERMEVLAARGEAEFDIDLYGMICDRLGRLFGRLGLERKSKDITPDLRSYLAGKDRPA
jgi:hypothetical protein